MPYLYRAVTEPDFEAQKRSKKRGEDIYAPISENHIRHNGM